MYGVDMQENNNSNLAITDDSGICIGSRIIFGKYEWRVLDKQNDRALIITDDIIEQRSYHDIYKAITWADCSLRKYLNSEFYDTFSETDKSRIITVLNKNLDNQWYGTEGGEDTEDKIFLLSIEEAVCEYFGDSSEELYNRGKSENYWFRKKDKNNNRRVATYKGGIWKWWLRSPGRVSEKTWLQSSGCMSKKAVYIHGDGNIGIQGNPAFGDNIGGVRPALWLDLESYEPIKAPKKLSDEIVAESTSEKYEFYAPLWGSGFSKYYQVSGDFELIFNLDVKGGNEVFNSYSIAFANTKRRTEGYFETIVRSDAYGWGNGKNKAFAGSTMTHEKDYKADKDFIACMRDASVVQKVSRNKNNFELIATFTGKNGSTYTRKTTFTSKVPSDMLIFLVADDALVTVYDVVISSNISINGKSI